MFRVQGSGIRPGSLLRDGGVELIETAWARFFPGLVGWGWVSVVVVVGGGGFPKVETRSISPT